MRDLTTSPIEPSVPPKESEDLIEFGVEARSQWRIIGGRFLRHKLAMASLLVIAAVVILILVGPHLYRYKYDQLNLEALSQGPSAKHWFGTDAIGHDTFAQCLKGAKRSIEVALLVASLSTAVGTIVGAVAGYFRGKLDSALMRLTDLFLTIPLLAVLLVVAARFRGRSGNWLAISLLIAGFLWMGLARVVRGIFLSLREKEFIEAARSVGASDFRIIFRHMIPNALGPIIVSATLAVATAILIETALSFLGFGIAPPDTSLGRLVADGAAASRTRPWLFYLPGLFLAIIVLCVNFLGDGIRDAFDPRQTKVRA